MKKSLYIRICSKTLGLLILLMPYFFSATSRAGTPLQKADYDLFNPAYPAANISASAIDYSNQTIFFSDTSIFSYTGSSQYTLGNLFNRNSKSNFIPGKSRATVPTVNCPGNKTANTDPSDCTASISGIAAVTNDPDGDIKTLTWTMTMATTAASPINGINNILGAYKFNKGTTIVTYRVTDALGGTNLCSFTVTVSDKQDPTIICPPTQNLTIPSCASTTDPISFSPLSMSDNCGILNFSSNAPPQFPLGTTPVLWTANDISGNSASCTQTVTVVNEPSMTLTGSSTPISCFGGNDGTASVVVSGGSPAYTYSWNTVPVQTGSTASNLKPGTYTVTVTDFYGCTATTSVTVSQPASALAVTVSGQSNVICFGTSTGSVTVAGNGGTPGYQYSINGVAFQASGTFSNLAAGVYTLTIKDSKNCTNTTTATITQPATGVTVAITSQANVTCLGTATGSVTVVGNGGTPPYQYNINGGAFQVSGTFGSLVAGTYNIIVKDANNCTNGVSVTITQSATALAASISAKTNVSCSGGANGSATVLASGGISPYTYSWNSVPVKTTTTATALSARNYTVTVTDAAGCKVTSNVTITQPAPLVVTMTRTNVACFGDSTGTATAKASGGTPPYTYAWIGPPIKTTATITNLPAGTYTVAVFDSLGCFKPAFITITQPATKLSASITSQANVACFGNNTGSVTISGSGGVAPIQYNINGGTYQASGTFSSLVAGVYSINAKDANNCTVTIPVTITAPAAALSATISTKKNVSCSGGASGSATVLASGGTTPYSYSWNSVPVQTTATAINLTARNYTVTVTDAAGCIKTAAVTITQPAPLVVTMSRTNVACFGDSTGTATALASGGTPPYTYAWIGPPIKTTATITNLPAGTYTVAVFDSLGCFKPAFITITQPATKLIASITGQVNVLCAGNNTGSITVSGSGGVAPIQYNINGGTFQASGTFSSLAAGVYTIIAKDANNCTVTIPATITAPASPLTASISSQTNVLCSGGTTGSATVTATGGTAPYTYSWTTVPVQTNASAINLASGNYTVIVTDAAGCSKTATATITQPAPIIVTTSKTDVSCFGDASGTATALVSGGTLPYTYSWNTVPAKTTAGISNLPAGTYTVTVTDALGCTQTASATITQPASMITVVVSNQVNIVCAGSNTGSVTVAGSGGTPGYQYSIDGVAFQASGTFSNLTAGVYTLTVKDSKNCIKTTTATITEPATGVLVSVTSQTNVSCRGTATGSATVSGSGGVAPYQYNINGGAFQVSGTFSSLVAGTYNIIVKDANNCTNGVSVTITQSATALTASISAKTNVSCSGGASGSATVLAVGGTAPYTYSWNSVPVQTSATAINLTARNYTATVTDAAGCKVTTNVTITQPAPLVVTMTRTNVACFGDSTGTATALASGGTPPYTYAWIGPPIQTTATITNLPAGTYTVAVFDSLGCFKPAFITITQPATKLIASITGQVNVLCAGNNTGSITVSGSGGVAPIQYNINGGSFQSSGTFNSLTAGSYTIVAKDANNCMVTIPATITEPASQLTALIASQTNVSCTSGPTGSATVTASGGTSPYTYLWNTIPAQTTATAINLAAGNYSVTVTDAAGCFVPVSVTIIQPDQLIVNTSKTDISCFGDSTGTASVLVSGGTSPYTYAWSTVPVQTTASISNLPAGNYTVTVTDALGCTQPASVTISQPASKLIASITDLVNVACSGNTGSVTVSGSGGTAPIQYSLNGGSYQATGKFTNLTAGVYTVTAKDASNCTIDVPVTITAPASVLAASISSQTNVSCSGGNTGSATVLASGGTSPYTYSWNTIPVQTTATATGLTARNYTVTVTDVSGCITTVNVTIKQPAPLNVTMSRTNVSCFGDSTGTVTALASGGTPPYTYAWLTTPIQTTATLTNLPAGTYTVAVIDSLGCFKPGFIIVTQPAQLTASITDQVNVACGGNTGSLTVSASGGVAPYQYSINGGGFQANGTFDSLSAGVYSVIAIDAHNCTFNLPAAITEPVNALRASITAQTNALCAGDANGSATVTATGGTAPYSYAWKTVPVQTSATINGLAAGNYIVTSTDFTGCFVTDTAFITEPLPLTASITNQVNYNCATGTNGSVIVAGADGTPGYQYSLDGGPYQISGTFTDLPVRNYIITVKDANNCESPLAVEITTSGLVLAVDDSFTTPEDTQLIDNVMINDQVLCNLPITVTAFTTPQHGVVTVNADGTFTYIPSLNYNGTDFFGYTITDDVGGTSSATVNITIDAVNDPPVTLNDSVTVNYNLASTGNILLNGHTDPDGTDLTVNTTPLLDPVNGTFIIAADGSFTYTPNLDYIGNDLVVVSICDAGIPLPPACSSDTLFIVVLPPNLPPVTVHENIVVCQDGTFTGTTTNGGTVFNGDSDPENNLPLTVNSIPVQDAAHGTFSITDAAAGTFSYVPNAGYTGSDFVIVSMCDSGIPVECSNDTIFIEVVTSIIADAGISQKLCNADVAFLVGNVTTIGTSGWTFISGPNTPVISPTTGNVAVASGLIASSTPYVFAYSTSNGGCITTDTMSVLNYTPATPSYAGMDQDFCNGTGSITATLAGNTPTDGAGTWTQLSGPTLATIEDATNPNTNVSDLTNGVYSFEWLISNGVCQANADVVNISVSQPATVNAGIDLLTCESLPVAVSGSTVLNSSSILWTTTGNGTFNDPAILTPVYTPGSLDITMGIVKLTLTATGISPCGDVSDFALLTINKNPTVNAGPDQPICVGNSKTISLASATDYSNLQWSVDPASAGTLTNSETLNPTFTPAAGFSGTATLTLSAQGIGLCTASEVADPMTIEVTSTLVADAGMGQIIPPGAIAALSGTVSGGSGFYSWSWQPAALLVNSLIENPVTLPLTETTTFTLSVLDITTGCTDDATVEIVVDSEANTIEAVADNDTTLINTSGAFDVLANDINPDNDPLTVSICGYPTHGLVIINSDNTITYTPYSDYEGEDEFCYRICSQVNPVLCSDATVYVHVKQPTLTDLFAYSGVSPNYDGLNDVWKIKGIEKYPDNTVIIFNRWGDKLREFANYNNTTRAWDGKNEKGEIMPDGTYYYILDVKNVGSLKGWIYIRGKN